MQVAHSSRFFLLALAVFFLAACGGQPSVTSGNNTVQVARVDGGATWQSVKAKAAIDLPESAGLQSGDEVKTNDNQSVTLRLADSSTLRLLPNSHLMLQIREADQRPIFRLLEGEVDVDARSNGFIVQAYRETAIKLRMMVYSLAALPKGASGAFNLWYDENIMKLYVTAGDVDVQTVEQQATLPVGWQAELDPEFSLKLTQVATSTPGPTPTPSDTPTATLTQTPSATPTATATRTLTRTPTRTLTPTPITTLISTLVQKATTLPTNTEPSEPSGSRPTKKPPPQSTEPPPPQPTEPPPPPPTEPPPPPPTEPPPPPPTDPPTLAPPV